MVITTEPGASPNKVERDITEPMESTLGTVSGVEKVISNSANNYSMIMLQFADGTNMDSTLVRVSQKIEIIDLPDGCGKPNLMEVSMDMMATMYAGIDYKGKDIKELSDFTTNTLKPYLERQEGVASITPMGLTTDSIEVKLNQDKIDKINHKILGKTNDKLTDASKEIEKAEKQIKDGESQLAIQKSKLNSTQKSTNKQLADAQVKLSQAQATKVAYQANLNSLKASKSALEAEKKAYTDAKLEDAYTKIDTMFATFNTQLEQPAKMAGITIPKNLEDAVNNKSEFNKFIKWLTNLGYKDQVKDLSYKQIKQVYNVVKVRLPQIDTELANLKTEITAMKMAIKQIDKQMQGMDKNQSTAISGGYSAAAGFGAGQAKISSAETELKNAKEKLQESKDKLNDSREVAIENSNIDALLSIDTLSQLITAQNFSMPAGYIDDKSDNQWLVDVGDNYENKKQLKSMVLTKVPGIGEIKLSDVADITVVDNSGESYSKINGRAAVLLAIYKSSTANTSEVAGNIKSAFKTMEGKYKGLSCTSLMDQSEYISVIVNTVLQSMLLGAILAIIVLALFLKDVKPTVIVAFSIPFSVVCAIIVMYFTGITLNVMSLAGLCIGIGMLVDNSIVVMENVYRLRNRGLSAPRAAVQGAKQVAAPIVSSTLTTICVFLPMIYVKGTENVDNGVTAQDKQLHLKINKNKAADDGLTVAQIYQQLAEKITTEKTSITITQGGKDCEVNVVNENNKPNYENILKTTIKSTTKDSEGNDVINKYKLSRYATVVEQEALNTIKRENQRTYISVTADVKDGYNATLLSRKIQSKLDNYKAPTGYTVEIQGESEQVMEMVKQLLLAILLGFILVYLVMVAQFQSLLSPFIIIFTVPLAFTGGMIGLMIFGKQISAMALMGFMILMGTVVNNGIVFVDYANQLRIQGVDKRTALIATGKTRMRPILMTAITTILSMSVMVFSQDAGNAMQKSMAIVVSFGLLYATIMTLFIVPILYDLLYRKQPKTVDLGDENLDDVPDEAAELIEKMTQQSDSVADNNNADKSQEEE